MSIISFQGGEFVARYGMAVGWGASVREAILECWAEHQRTMVLR